MELVGKYSGYTTSAYTRGNFSCVTEMIGPGITLESALFFSGVCFCLVCDIKNILSLYIRVMIYVGVY